MLYISVGKVMMDERDGGRVPMMMMGLMRKAGSRAWHDNKNGSHGGEYDVPDVAGQVKRV